MRTFTLAAVRMMAVIAVTLLPAVASANAEPEASPALAVSPTLPLRYLGSAPDLLFYGQIGTVVLTIPVPAGMTPASLNVTVQIPVYVRSANLTVSQDNRLLTQVELPPAGGPLAIPLDGVRVRDNAVTLLLRSYLLPLDGYCLDPSNPLRLANSAVTFTGVESAPTVVADFLPPVLRKLDIYVGPKPSQTEADAVVKLATSVAAHYGGQNPEIEVRQLAGPAAPPPGAAQPLERQIVVAEGPDAGVSLYGPGPIPALLITGPVNELTNQTRLITSAIARYALGSKAVPGPLKSTPQLPGNETTIRRLGQPGVNASALNPQVGINLDQTRLGRPVRDVRVHLIGSYTPLPAAIGGQVMVSVGGQTIARWPAEASGLVDRWVDVPNSMLQRLTTLNVQVNIAGNTGRCGEFQPITLTIDGESVVQTTSAAPPVPIGFQSLPQGLMPKVQVGFGDDGSFANTARAVLIMTGLQRLSALPIDTAVVPLADALKSPSPAVLISPDGWDHPELPLKVTAPDTVPTTLNVVDDDGNPTTLTLQPGVRFGSLQVVFDGKRSILVATSNGGAVDQLDRLLSWLDGDLTRWPSLNGIGVVSIADRDPVTVPGGVGVDDTAAAPHRDSPRWWWWAGGGLAAASAAAATWLLVRSRRNPLDR